MHNLATRTLRVFALAVELGSTTTCCPCAPFRDPCFPCAPFRVLSRFCLARDCPWCIALARPFARRVLPCAPSRALARQRCAPACAISLPSKDFLPKVSGFYNFLAEFCLAPFRALVRCRFFLARPCAPLRSPLRPCAFLSIVANADAPKHRHRYIHTRAHTHTHIYIYIYIYTCL